MTMKALKNFEEEQNDFVSFLINFRILNSTKRKPVCLSYKNLHFKNHLQLIFLVVKPLITETLDGIFNFLKKNDSISANMLKIKFILRNTLNKELAEIMIRSLSEYLKIKKKKNILTGDSSKDRFSSFIEELLTPEGIKHFFDTYPECKAKVNNMCNQYRFSLLELFHRLASDMAEIGREIITHVSPHIEHSNLKLIDLKRMGDFHIYGRFVTYLKFKDATGKTFELIYKPHDVEIDGIFNQILLPWFSKNTNILFKDLNLLVKEGYGWFEFIKYNPCSSLKEIKEFYYRLGVLTSFFHALSTADLHADNLIANGAIPVFVDLECLFHARMKKGGIAHPNVLTTMIVPNRRNVTDFYSGFDNTAIDGYGKDDHVNHQYKTLNIGFDNMRTQKVRVKIGKKQNIPSYKGKPISPLQYQRDFELGFKKGYKSLVNNKELAKLIYNFSGKKSRLLIKNTHEYKRIIRDSFTPAVLASSCAQMKFLNSNVLAIPEVKGFKNILSAEIDFLQKQRIPYFYTEISSGLLFDQYGRVFEEVQLEDMLTKVISYLQKMGDADLEFQLALIQLSFSCSALNHARKPKSINSYKNYQFQDADGLLKNLKISKNEKRNRFYLTLST